MFPSPVSRSTLGETFKEQYAREKREQTELTAEALFTDKSVSKAPVKDESETAKYNYYLKTDPTFGGNWLIIDDLSGLYATYRAGKPVEQPAGDFKYGYFIIQGWTKNQAGDKFYQELKIFASPANIKKYLPIELALFDGQNRPAIDLLNRTPLNTNVSANTAAYNIKPIGLASYERFKIPASQKTLQETDPQWQDYVNWLAYTYVAEKTRCAGALRTGVYQLPAKPEVTLDEWKKNVNCILQAPVPVQDLSTSPPTTAKAGRRLYYQLWHEMKREQGKNPFAGDVEALAKWTADKINFDSLSDGITESLPGDTPGRMKQLTLRFNRGRDFPGLSPVDAEKFFKVNINGVNYSRLPHEQAESLPIGRHTLYDRDTIWLAITEAQDGMFASPYSVAQIPTQPGDGKYEYKNGELKWKVKNPQGFWEKDFPVVMKIAGGAAGLIVAVATAGAAAGISMPLIGAGSAVGGVAATVGTGFAALNAVNTIAAGGNILSIAKAAGAFAVIAGVSIPYLATGIKVVSAGETITTSHNIVDIAKAGTDLYNVSGAKVIMPPLVTAAEKIGETLKPITAIVQPIIDLTKPIISAGETIAKPIITTVETISKPIIITAETVVKPVVAVVETVVKPIVSAGETIAKPIQTFAQATAEIVQPIAKPIGSIAQTTGEVVESIADIVKPIADVAVKLPIDQVLTAQNVIQTPEIPGSSELRDAVASQPEPSGNWYANPFFIAGAGLALILLLTPGKSRSII